MELPGRDGPDERPDSLGRIDDLLAAGVLPGIDPDQELRRPTETMEWTSDRDNKLI